MSATTPAALRPPRLVDVRPGPLLLSSVDDPPGLEHHLVRWGSAPRPTLETLLEAVGAAGVRGRGGAGFPLARKLAAAAGARGRLGHRRAVVVVNAAEGEPASAKDSSLLRVAPHLVLDGAAAVAHALGAHDVHVVTSADRPWVGEAVAVAIRERGDGDGRVRWKVREAAASYVSGQSRAVIELLSGRPGLPVTAWAPEAVDGLRGRPTLLSNAESFAHLAALLRVGASRYGALGSPQEPGTTLLTLSRPAGDDGVPREVRVVEVGHGSPVTAVLGSEELRGPVMVGGYHGAWIHPRHLDGLRWASADLSPLGASLGAGAVVELGTRDCAVAETARVVSYLAGESAGRCGPCRNGLPALAGEVSALAEGDDTRWRIVELTGLVAGRGACAHPDGTARLVTSLLMELPDVVDGHLDGCCSCTLAAEVVDITAYRRRIVS